MEVHPILTPVLSILDELELLPGQRMEGVGYAETFVRIVLMRCIRRRSPKVRSRAACNWCSAGFWRRCGITGSTPWET